MAETATATPAPDTEQATPDSLPEVTVNAQRTPVAVPDEATGPIRGPAQSFSDFNTEDAEIAAMARIDPDIARVMQAQRTSPEAKQAAFYEDEQTRQLERASVWDTKQADLAEKYAQWTQRVGPAMAQYIENTPNRSAIYASNMHIAPMLAIVSAIGGKLTRASGLQMLAATTGAVQGMNAGNEQAYQDQMTKYKAGLDAFQEQVKMQNDYYEMMLKSYAGRADAAEKAAAAAERASGNIRTEQQKTLASAIQAKRATDTALWQMGHLGVMQDANQLKREMNGLAFAQGRQMGAQGLDQPISRYNPWQIAGLLNFAGVPLQGSMTKIALEIGGLQTAVPNTTVRQLADTMRENKLSLLEAQSAIRTMARRTYPTAQAYAALAGPTGIMARLKANAARLDLGSSQVQNEIQFWMDHHWSANPDVRRYMTDLEDARTELAVVLSRGGQMSDHARTWAEEALPAITSQDALNQSINESLAIGQRVLAGDERAMALVVKGGHISDIFNQTAQPAAPGAAKPVIPASPQAGTTVYDQKGQAWVQYPNGYMQRADGSNAGEIVAPELDPNTGKPTGKWRRVSGQPPIAQGQGVGGAGASMDYANEMQYGDYYAQQYGAYGGGGGGYGGGGYGGGGYGGGPYPRGPSAPWTVASDLIRRYESRGGENVMNYLYKQDPAHRTASGPWQITASNFHNYGARLGIDTSQWRYAMDAPEEIQEQIAEAMYQEQGFAPWAPFNPALARAIGYG